jgi:hypothetical protein
MIIGRRQIPLILAFAGGVAFTLTGRVGFNWWAMHSGQWSVPAFRISFVDVDMPSGEDGNPTGFVFRFEVQNDTDRSYSIQGNGDIGIFMSRAGSLVSASGAKIQKPMFVEPRGRADLLIEIPYDTVQSLASPRKTYRASLADLEASPATEEPKSNYERAVSLIPRGLAGLVVIDRSAGYRLVAPRGW